MSATPIRSGSLRPGPNPFDRESLRSRVAPSQLIGHVDETGGGVVDDRPMSSFVQRLRIDREERIIREWEEAHRAHVTTVTEPVLKTLGPTSVGRTDVRGTPRFGLWDAHYASPGRSRRERRPASGRGVACQRS